MSLISMWPMDENAQSSASLLWSLSDKTTAAHAVPKQKPAQITVWCDSSSEDNYCDASRLCTELRFYIPLDTN